MADKMELKDVLSFIGMEEVTSIEEFKEKFPQKHFTEQKVFEDKELLNKFTGVTLGKVQQNIGKIFKANGVAIPDEEAKTMKIEDYVNKGLELKESEFQESMEKTKSLVSKGADEKFQELTHQHESALQKIKDLEDLNKSTVDKYEGELKGWNEKLNNFKRDTVETSIFSQLSYGPEVDDLRKEGYLARVKNKYQIDLDENDAPIIRNKETGKRIENPNKHGEYLAPLDVLKADQIEMGVAPKNKVAGTPVRKTLVTSNEPGGEEPPKQIRKIASRARM